MSTPSWTIVFACDGASPLLRCCSVALLTRSRAQRLACEPHRCRAATPLPLTPHPFCSSYKDAIMADFKKDPRVKNVIDVGVNSTSDKTRA